MKCFSRYLQPRTFPQINNAKVLKRTDIIYNFDFIIYIQVKSRYITELNVVSKCRTWFQETVSRCHEGQDFSVACLYVPAVTGLTSGTHTSCGHQSRVLCWSPTVAAADGPPTALWYLIHSFWYINIISIEITNCLEQSGKYYNN